MSPNRLVALVAALSAAASALLPILGAVTTLPQAIVLCVVVLAVAAIAIVWLIGWQKHEGHAADPSSLVPALPIQVAPSKALDFPPDYAATSTSSTAVVA